MKHEWKSVPVDTSVLLEKEFEDFAGIEELTDYTIISSKGEERSLKRKKKRKNKTSKKKSKVPCNKEHEKFEDGASEDLDMSAWCNCFVPDLILKALKDLKFSEPTPIQSLAIPSAIRDHRDILGAAETGSGKTLAFGIPIVSAILSLKEKYNLTNESDEGRLYSLILTPTRELAIQIKNHLQNICKYTNIKIAPVIGGLALEKQRRVLKKCPEIVVATPGRLWELMEEGEPHLSQIPSVKYLVIDEADRMLEKGHFAELSQILNLINGNKNNKRQNFVFSATLTLVHDLPKRLIFKKNQSKLQQKVKLDKLINSIGMRQPHVIDITKKTNVVETLTESMIMCSLDEKDSYLYYFVTLYPGRTIVFCNSIDCVRRLKTILEYLNCNCLPLHASMHQKQRLKNLERFASSQNAILLATDVAARGLDIRGIEHVIHYQVPRTAESYVHRSGRTARAQNEGLSLMLIEPEEGKFYKRICKTLNKDKPLPTFPINNNTFKVLKERVTLARTIDKSEHRIKRLNAQNRWLLNVAKDVDVDIEDEDLLNDLGSEHEQSKKNREINILKKRLKALLQKQIIPKTFRGSYPTKSGKLVCPSTTGSEQALKVLQKEQKKHKK